jgi:uncharacterized membrane protein YphA (DoxX/SURF4 family)
MESRRTPAFWLTLLRIAIGGALLISGVEKVLNPSYIAQTLRPTLEAWAAHGDSIATSMGAAVIPHVEPFAFALEAIEILAGLALIFGFLANLGALAGFVIIGGAWMLKHSYDSLAGYGDVDFMVMATMLFLALTPSGRFLGVDAALFRRRPTIIVPSPVPPPPVATAPTVPAGVTEATLSERSSVATPR